MFFFSLITILIAFLLSILLEKLTPNKILEFSLFANSVAISTTFVEKQNSFLESCIFYLWSYNKAAFIAIILLLVYKLIK